MNRKIAIGLSILGVTAVVGWKVASQPETGIGLHDIRLIQHSEHSQPGPTELAGIRIRLSPTDFRDTVRADEVPQIALVSE